MASGAASESQPRAGGTQRGGAYAAASPASPGRLGARRSPSYAQLNEDAGEKKPQLLPSSKGLVFLSAVWWEIDEAQSLPPFSLPRSPPGSSAK